MVEFGWIFDESYITLIFLIYLFIYLRWLKNSCGVFCLSHPKSYCPLCPSHKELESAHFSFQDLDVIENLKNLWLIYTTWQDWKCISFGFTYSLGKSNGKRWCDYK